MEVHGGPGDGSQRTPRGQSGGPHGGGFPSPQTRRFWAHPSWGPRAVLEKNPGDPGVREVGDLTGVPGVRLGGSRGSVWGAPAPPASPVPGTPPPGPRTPQRPQGPLSRLRGPSADPGHPPRSAQASAHLPPRQSQAPHQHLHVHERLREHGEPRAQQHLRSRVRHGAAPASRHRRTRPRLPPLPLPPPPPRYFRRRCDAIPVAGGRSGRAAAAMETPGGAAGVLPWQRGLRDWGHPRGLRGHRRYRGDSVVTGLRRHQAGRVEVTPHP